MEKLINLLRSNNYQSAADKARTGKASKEELAFLKDFSDQAGVHIESRLIQLESIAKAVQVACIDADNSGMYDHKIDGFNFAYWIQEEAQALHSITALKEDAEYLIRGGDA